MSEFLFQLESAIKMLDKAPKNSHTAKAYEHLLEARFILKQRLTQRRSA